MTVGAATPIALPPARHEPRRSAPKLRRVAVCFTAAFLAVVILIPAASALPAVLGADVSMPLRLGGQVAASATDAALLFERADSALTWSFGAAQGTLVAVEYWEHVRDDGVRLTGAASGVRTSEHGLRDFSVAVTERSDGFVAYAWSEDPDATLQTTAGTTGASSADDLAAGATPGLLDDPDTRMFRLGAPLVIDSAPAADGVDVVGTVLGRPVPFSESVPMGQFQLRPTAAKFSFQGDLGAYVTDAEIRVVHDDGALALQLGETVEERPGSVYVPGEGWTGPGSHQERIVRYAQLDAAAAHLVAEEDGETASVFAASMLVSLSGRLATPAASGSLTFEDGEQVELTDDLSFMLTGVLDGRISPTDASTEGRLQATGDVAYVRSGTDASAYPIAAVAGAAAGLAAIGLLGVLAWKGKSFVLGLALFSRVARSDALSHASRAQIYALIQARPGLSPHEMVDDLGVGWSTITYHLDVLERNELVIAHKEGRYRRYFDRASGLFANGRKKIMSVLQNDMTARIAALIKADPGVVQRRLADGTGLAPSSVHWHVARLVDAGLVEKRRAARAVALFPGPGWEKLQVLIDEGCVDPLSALRPDPAADGPSA